MLDLRLKVRSAGRAVALSLARSAWRAVALSLARSAGRAVALSRARSAGRVVQVLARVALRVAGLPASREACATKEYSVFRIGENALMGLPLPLLFLILFSRCIAQTRFIWLTEHTASFAVADTV